MNGEDERDESIKRLLAGLGSVEPAPGFSQRVITRVEARRRSPQPSRRVQVAWACGLATACGLALLVALAAHRRHDAEGTQAQARPAAAVEARPSTEAGPVLAASATIPSAKPASGLGRRVRVRLRERRMDGAVRLTSFPAPPLPLTGEERLLAAIARSGNEQEMAMLDPEIQTRVDARQRAVFHRVFEQGVPAFQVQPFTQERGDE